jgi:hypothetical protein
VLRRQVSEAFRKNQHETDKQKIEGYKQAYVCHKQQCATSI